MLLLNQKTRADFANVKILNSGAWLRKSELVPVSLPLAIEDLLGEVDEYYQSKHQGRKLRWNNMLSHGTVSLARACVKEKETRFI